MIINPALLSNLENFKATLAQHNVRFFDFGCSHGGGTLWAQKATQSTGLGFDVDTAKLKLADEKGLLCCAYDILSLPAQKLVPFTTIFHMLEHLSSVAEARAFISTACDVSQDQVIIKQPFYDADTQLFRLGLKTFYSHWSGHKNQMTTPDFYFILAELRARKAIRDFAIGYKLPILNSDSPIIHPLESPINCHEYDALKHPPKKSGLEFDFPLYYEIQIAIDISGKGYGALWAQLGPEEIVYDTRNAGLQAAAAKTPVAARQPQPVNAKLRKQPGSIKYFLRDDDFGKLTKKFEHLEEIAKQRGHVMLAAIPDHLDVDAASAARIKQHFTLAQHGYVHRSHALGDAKNEFPDTRPSWQVKQDLVQGRGILEGVFGQGAADHFVAPWNRFSPVHFDVLEQSGFRSFQGIGAVDHHGKVPLIGYCINFTALYLEHQGNYDKILEQAAIRADDYINKLRRRFDANTYYLPINTHHMMMDDGQFACLRRLQNDLEAMYNFTPCKPTEAIDYYSALKQQALVSA